MKPDQLHTQMHQGQMGITEGDIQAYDEANREQFGDQTLTQGRDQIRTSLQSQQEDQFVQDYIQRLKDNATITRDFTLLEVPEPGETELKAYYEANLEQYVIPAQAVVDESRVPGGQDEAAAREKASKALVRLRSGEDFAAVAGEFSDVPFSEGGTTVRKGQRDPAYDEVVFNLDEEQISDVFRAGDAFFVVRLRAVEPERQPGLDEVREQVRQAVIAEKFAAWPLPDPTKTIQKASRGRSEQEKAQAIQDAAQTSLGIRSLHQVTPLEMSWLLEQMDLLDRQMKLLDKTLSALLPPEGQLLVTIPGLSTVLATTILGEIGDIQRFPYLKSLIAYAGLDPSVYQSGHFEAAETSLSKRGSPYLRRAVWLATTTARRFNPDLHAFYQRKRRQGKQHNTAMGATCHRLLAHIYAILKEQRPYEVR